MTRSSFRYQSPPKNDEEELRLALIKLAKKYGRYGYRKTTALLRMEGWTVNHKKVERIWREEGLQLPKRHKKRRRLYHKDSSVIRLRPQCPNHIWSVDFVHDKLSSGRSYKMLTVLDEYTRQALCVEVKPKMGSADVLEALYKLLLKHGKRLHSFRGCAFTTGHSGTTSFLCFHIHRSFSVGDVIAHFLDVYFGQVQNFNFTDKRSNMALDLIDVVLNIFRLAWCSKLRTSHT